jgi:NDP-sugar pyrophosphorylase family protein
MKGGAPFKAMIMAAGLGTRLLPLTELTAKPMVPILNRPVMEHILRLLVRHGVREVAVNLHYHPEVIRQYFGDGSRYGVEMHYRAERDLLGTAGGVGSFREFLGDDAFLVISGDALTDIDLTAFARAHTQTGGIGTMAVMNVDDPSRYGVVVPDDRGRVVGFQEKPSREVALSHLCNCGIYAFDPRVFEYIPADRFVDFAQHVFPALLAADESLHAWHLDGYWNDVGNIEQYRIGNFDALTGRVRVQMPGRQLAPGIFVGDGSEIDGSASLMPPMLIGDRCRIGADASLHGPLIIGDDCLIEDGAVLDGVIHWDGASTGQSVLSIGGILGRGVKVHHNAVVCEGAVVGDGASIAAHAIVSPGMRVRPQTSVSAGPLSSGSDLGECLPENPAAL